MQAQNNHSSTTTEARKKEEEGLHSMWGKVVYLKDTIIMCTESLVATHTFLKKMYILYNHGDGI